MTERMYRAQILLDPQQHRRLEAIARRDGKSISAVTRQVIDVGLEHIENETELWSKRALLLSNLRLLRERQTFTYTGDLVNEVRQEREDERNRLWANPS
jgi:hypothetical protein